MARRKVRGLDEALNELFANYEQSLTEAMKYAAKEAKEEIKLEAESCLEDYYLTYRPTSYDRTDNLYDAFIPYMNVRKVGNGIVADVGMGYWPMMLDGVYKDGSNQWRPVEGEWVLENYLNGIHPTTDGSTYVGAPYIPVKDDKSPNEKMREYLEAYGNTFNDNLLVSFAKQIAGR